jgi:hypothetical protein
MGELKTRLLRFARNDKGLNAGLETLAMTTAYYLLFFFFLGYFFFTL